MHDNTIVLSCRGRVNAVTGHPQLRGSSLHVRVLKICCKAAENQDMAGGDLDGDDDFWTMWPKLIALLKATKEPSVQTTSLVSCFRYRVISPTAGRHRVGPRGGAGAGGYGGTSPAKHGF